jgi:hypothetical protein
VTGRLRARSIPGRDDGHGCEVTHQGRCELIQWSGLGRSRLYDALAPWYHLVYQDWEASVARQGQALASLLASEGRSPSQDVLDAAVGIGTQALGLAHVGSGLRAPTSRPWRSTAPVTRPRVSRFRFAASLRDVRALPVRSATFDAVIALRQRPPALALGRRDSPSLAGIPSVPPPEWTLCHLDAGLRSPAAVRDGRDQELR